jgi:(p)ppGpp synthase/HD superfamily hydrolase
MERSCLRNHRPMSLGYGMELVAQTNLQLYNQLRAQGYSDEELLVVHRAYEFLTTIYPGYYQADGKPFVAHTVGVASILAHLQLPTEFIAAGLLHNIYGNGDFGDGRRYVATARRRRIVRKAVGDRIEVLIERFRRCRIRPKSALDILSRIDQFDEIDKKLIVMDLADYLEKYIDLGVCYWGDSESLADTAAKHGDTLVAIADRVGYPQLAAMLNEAFAHASAAQIPNSLRASNGWKGMDLVVPRSCRRRLRPILSKQLNGLWRSLRRTFPIRRRLRQLRSAISRPHTIQHS